MIKNTALTCFLAGLAVLIYAGYISNEGVPAFALSCQKITVDESVEYADVIFFGNAAIKEYDSTDENITFVTFDVTELYKGITTDSVIITSDEDMWGPVFQEKENYVIFANYSTNNYTNYDNVLIIPLCSSTRVSDPGFVEQMRWLFSIEISEEPVIPSWIRSNAKWWSAGQIDGNTFVSGIKFLIQTDVIHLEKTVPKPLAEKPGEIPSWIKNNADWWSQGMISDDDFLKGIKYLVEHRIIIV